MARRSQNAAFADDEQLGPTEARRLGVWATIAVAAVFTAVVAGFVNSGSRNGAQTAEPGYHAAAAATTPGSPAFSAEMGALRVADAVRLLASDRDRSMARINTLESARSFVTGSIQGGAAGSPPVDRPTPSATANPRILVSATTNSPTQAMSTAAGASPARRQQPVAERFAGLPAIVDSGTGGSVATKSDFGVELGSAASVDVLRASWLSIRGANEALFDGLRPVVSTREGSKGGTSELRLVVGPLPNAGAAARLCATLTLVAVRCRPAIFDGQRLVLN